MRTRQRLLGLGALVVLAGIVVGLPVLLVALGGNPLPSTVPSLDQVRTALLTPDDGTLALTGAKVLGWVLWAALTLSIVVEAATALRGVRAPRLPALSVPQAGMRPLVVAALALFIAAPGGTVPVATAAPATATTSAPVSATPTSAAPGTPVAATPPTATTGPESTRAYTVRPGDTLWSIAERHLGSGHAYQRIVDLNQNQLAGGPDWVTPGMVLQLPATEAATSPDAQDQRQVVVQAGDTLSALAAEHLGDGSRWPEIYEASTGTVQPDGQQLTDPDLIYPGWGLVLPETAEHLDRSVPTTTAARTAADASIVVGTEADGAEQPAAEPDRQRTEASPAGTASARSGLALGAVTTTHTAEHAEPGTAQDTGSGRTGDVALDRESTAGDVEEGEAPGWLLEGLVGAGAMLGGALFLTLTLRRRSRFRARRPGRALAPPDPALAPVEKTIQTRGRSAAHTLEQLDQALRRLGGACAATGVPVPAVAAVQLVEDGMWLHLSEPADLGAPWQNNGDGQHWFLPAGTPVEQVGPLEPDAPAPFPLLVSIGGGDDGSAWLLNLEDLEVTLTGDPAYVDDLARYLAAEVAVNPWSAGVRLDCVGIAAEVAPMNPARVRIADADAVEDLVAEVVGVIDRVGQTDVPTARVRQDGEDTWPARLVLLSTDDVAPVATDQLRQLLAEHPGSTSASVVLRSSSSHTDTALHIEATADGRVRIPAAGLDLVGVGLTADEAAGCAALLAQSHAEPDVPMPAATRGDTDLEEGWRGWTDQAGAIRPEHSTGRDTAGHHQGLTTLLPERDGVYEQEAATTAEDLSTLAPQVESGVAHQVLQADPTLDADLAAWWDQDVRVPRLTLLGPVKAQTWGKPLAERKGYMTELLTYLAVHPHGVTTGQAAEAFGITEARIRDYIGRCREWLGTDPATGDLHIPHAPDTPASRARGVNVYQVLGLLVDVDLFRRLRTRAAARGGTEGIKDLKAALRLVQGRPFDQLRSGGWGWMFEGDRLDHHMTCAVVDVAHIVATHDLQTGDLAGARAAAEIALLAAPDEEIPTLDLVAVTAREGNTAEAISLLKTDVCNRTDDPDLPPGDLPERTQRILDRHGWLEDRKEAV